MSAGLFPTGLIIKSTDDIVTEIGDELKTLLGASFDTSADSLDGQLIGTFASKAAEVWQLVQLVYAAQYPAGATGSQLDQLLSLTGVRRLPAKQSTVTVTLTGTPGTVVAAGRVFSVTGTGAKFTTDATATIGGGGTVSATCTSSDFGPIIAAAGTLTVIETPVGGLSSVTNPLDAKVGNLVESDAAAKLRRVQLLRATGAGSVEAIRAKVLTVADVLQAIVFENTTLTTDGSGVPGKAFETVVQAGVNADIAAAIFAVKPAGIQAYGSTTVSVNDSYGNAHSIGFSRPTTQNIYISVSLTSDSTYGGNAAVKQAIVDYGNTFRIGQSVVRSLLFAAIESVSGITDVTNITLGTAPSPVGTSNIVLTSRQLALFDTSRILVNGV